MVTPSAQTTSAPKLLSQNELHALGPRVEHVLGGSKVQLGQMNDALVRRLHEALQALPPDTRTALLHGGPASQLRTAYLVGQLAFAQAMVSQAFVHRADDDFLNLLSSSTYGPLVLALYRLEMSNQTLATFLEEAPETVSRKLRALRDRGITDYRKDGRAVLNFLTPAARQALETSAAAFSAS